MNEFKELDVLENADESVKERLAEEFPPQDDNEKERVFNMSKHCCLCRYRRRYRRRRIYDETPQRRCT